MCSEQGMAIRLHLLLVILSLAVTKTLATVQVYCEVRDNEYYVRQWGNCKACDRCPVGYGLNTKKHVKLDPVHGALQCRDCVKCSPGETFSSEIGYGECERCTNCTENGQREDVACSAKSDAVCKDIPVIQSAAHIQQNRQEADSNHNDVQEQVSEKADTGMNPTITIIGAVVLAVFLVPTMTLLVVYRKKLAVCRKGGQAKSVEDVEEQRSLNEELGNDSPATLETKVEFIPLDKGISEPLVRSSSMQSEGLPSLASNFSYQLPETGLRNDIETDAVLLPDPRTNETPPSDKVLQGLCNDIAHRNLYAQLGRVLGVEDNEIQRIKEEERGHLKETAFQTLKRWRELKGTGATKSVLRQALNDIGLHNVQLKDDP